MGSTVILIDDHPFSREKISGYLQQFPEFTVVGEADDARAGEVVAQKYRPNIAILELSLPDFSGIHLTGILLSKLPETRITIVTRHRKIDYVIAALGAGALGYIVKDSMEKSLHDCLLATLSGDHFLDPALSGQIAGHLLNNRPGPFQADSPYNDLSPREREILHMLTKGLATKEIGEKLFISPKTVANHRTSIMAKLDVHSTAQLMRLTTQQNILGLVKPL